MIRDAVGHFLHSDFRSVVFDLLIRLCHLFDAEILQYWRVPCDGLSKEFDINFAIRSMALAPILNDTALCTLTLQMFLYVGSDILEHKSPCVV